MTNVGSQPQNKGKRRAEDDMAMTLSAESMRVQLALATFYRGADTHALNVSTITPDLLSKIPTSKHLDIRVQIGSSTNNTLLFCTRFELAAKMLLVPDVPNAVEWWEALEDMIYTSTSMCKNITVDDHVFEGPDYFVKVVEANPLLLGAWFYLGKLLSGKGQSATITETNFTPFVAMDVSSAWGDLENVLAEGARAFEKESISIRGAPYTTVDCYLKVIELDPSSLDGWLALSTCMTEDTSFKVKSTTYTFKECLMKVVNSREIFSDSWIQKCEERLKVLHRSNGASDEISVVQASYEYILHTNPAIKAAWCKLGYILHSENQKSPEDEDGEEDAEDDEAAVVVISGKSFTAKGCCVHVLEVDPQYPNAWLSLYNIMTSNGDEVVVSGKTYTCAMCIAQVLEIDPARSRLWCTMGEELLNPYRSLLYSLTGIVDNKQIDEKMSVIVSGTTYTAQQCFVKAVTIDPLFDEAWQKLGEHLDEAIAINGESYTPKQCYAKALTIDPAQSELWCTVGDFLLKEEHELFEVATEDEEDYDEDEEMSVVISGSTYTARHCFAKAVTIDPLHDEAWHKLGSQLMNEAIAVNGVSYTTQQCYAKALVIDPLSSDYWLDMATEISFTAKSVEVSGTCYTRRQCLVKALECDPSNHRGWSILGGAVELDGGLRTICVADKAYTALQCYTQALEMGDSDWSCVGRLLSDNGESVEIDGTSYDRKQCCLKALEYSQYNTDAWLILGGDAAKAGDKHVVVKGRSYTPQQCFVRVLKVTSTSSEAWSALADTLSPTGATVSVNKVIYNREECINMAEVCARKEALWRRQW